jgi:hypothetical protein
MTTIVKFLITLLLGIILTSCKFDYNIVSGIKGNGNVITQERYLNKVFNKINAAEGLNVFLTKANTSAVKVQADENLHEYIITEVEEGVLYLHTKESLGKANAKNVLVSFNSLNEISSASGASVKTTNFINPKSITIKASSGSYQKLSIKANSINCTSSSGAMITINGESNNINAKASSGSTIDAFKLISENCETKTSSGAKIDVYCKSLINANASSGSNISYEGNPKSVSKSKSSGARIAKH